MDEPQLKKWVEMLQFGSESEMASASANIVKLGEDNGVKFGSSENLYQKFITNEERGVTVPAINVRTLTYDFAKLMTSLIGKLNKKYLIFELAPTEGGYTNQSPLQFAGSILAGAIASGYQGEVIVQGDHYQFNASQYATDAEGERLRLKGLIDESISAGFGNIDIDASTLVDYSRSDVSSQQKENIAETKGLLMHIRNKYPQKNIAVGGEIGHIGDRNSTPEEVEYFLGQMRGEENGLVKVAVQTGTTHGGKIDQSGKNITMPIDLDLIENLGAVAHRLGVAGIVQHGASTLPIDILAQLSSRHVVEAHLSTGWQNIFFDNLPDHLKQEMYGYIRSNLISESKSIWNEAEMIYRLRKKTLGPFKEKIWSLSEEEKTPIISAWSDFARKLFLAFGLQ